MLLLLGLIVGMQQFVIRLHGATLEHPLQEMVADESARDPGVGELAVVSKQIVKQLAFERALPDHAANPAAAASPSDPDTTEELTRALAHLDRIAISRTDRFRVAIVVAELRGAPAAIERLTALSREVEPSGELAADVGWMRDLYRAAGRSPVEIHPDDAARLIERHGWFGRLALVFARPEADESRREAVGGYRGVAKLSLAVIAFNTIAFLAGLILLVIMIRKAHGGDFWVRVEESGVPSFLYAEAFVVFLTLFLIVLAADVLLIGETGTMGVIAREIALWLCAAAVLWPLLRGANWDELRTDLGLTAGEGPLAEVSAGVAGFLVSVPLTLLVGIVIGAVERAIDPGDGAAPGGVPMFQQPLSASWAAVVLGAVSSIVWAPLVEESMFRGALHRWLPAWLRVGGRVAVSSAVFGLVHPYSPSGMAQVAAGGVVFGLLREWRGSLVAGMTCHALHNAAIEFITIGTLAALE
jgi:hypothetical protein